MGSGKTHIGKLLAEALNCQFIDLDEYIEAKEDASVTQIFADKGEQHFRFVERLALRETYDFKKSVIATGGGTPCFFDSMEWMNEGGVTIWIKASKDLLIRRLYKEQKQRPLLKDKTIDALDAYIEAKMAERIPYYSQAKIHFTVEDDLTEKGIKGLLLQLSQVTK